MKNKRNQFDMLNDIKINTDEYEEINFKDNDDLKNKMKSKIRQRKNNKVKQFMKVSSIAIVGTVGLSVINPDIVRAIPIIGQVIAGFDSSTFGEPVDKYVKYAQGVDLIVEDKGATVYLKDVLVDDNMFMLGLVVESEILDGFDGKNEYDFINTSEYIFLNDEQPQSIGSVGRKIDDTTAAVIITGNIAELDLEEDIKIDINMTSIKGAKGELSGEWNFKVEYKKLTESEIVNVNKEYEVNGQKLIIKDVIMSPITNTIMMGGTDKSDDYRLQSTQYKILDDKENVLRSNMDSSSLQTDTGELNQKIQIDSSLEDTEYIDLYPYLGTDVIDKEIEGAYHNLLITTGIGEREEVLISREPSKEELDSGYALDKVYYYINMDKEEEFLSIDELIGYEIFVNNKTSVTIKDINVSDKGTKITLKKNGDYDHLGGLVIFDEDMNDYARWEGHKGAVLENEEENIYSITLDKIDTSKKYKIALPQIKDINLDDEQKIRIDLNK